MSSPQTVDDLVALFDEAFIEQLYRTLLGREPDPAGKASHLSQLRRGYTKDAFIAHFAASEEGCAHGNQLDGLTDLCSRVKSTEGRKTLGRLMSKAHAAGLVTTQDVAITENRIGRQLLHLSATLDRLVAQIAQIVTMSGRGAQAQEALGTRLAVTDQRLESLDQHVDRVNRAAAGLDERVTGIERLLAGVLAQQQAAESRQRADVDALGHRIQEALERLEVRLALGLAGGATATRAEPSAPGCTTSQAALRALDSRAVQRVRQLLDGGSRGE